MEKSKFVNRGGIWVALQMVLLVLVLIIPIYLRLAGRETGWGWPLGSVATMLGIMLLVIGVMFIRRAFADLGDNLTPYPKPINKGTLVRSGVYGIVRHPIYTAVILLGLGWALALNSGLALLGAVVIFLFFDSKARREEAWLLEKYPDYARYRQQVKKLLPGIY
ncbi:MAG: isoprenylcysteine carboxylmethyltransferase family protein [Anaerolineae bacterium]|nr:isoprenylcysteine carboxylmethyltransferase family protein [Anaerolineae bacterium]